jgi:hypothetical protein
MEALSRSGVRLCAVEQWPDMRASILRRSTNVRRRTRLRRGHCGGRQVGAPSHLLRLLIELRRAPKLAARVERALVRAEESARRTARMYGTPLYVWENGRVVAKRP